VGPPGGDSRSALVAVTKLRAPAARDLVARPALVERLATKPDLRLTLVAAPAGWGKTTLLAAWAQAESPHRFAWLSLDGWDNDPMRFWTYVVEALRTVEPTLGAEPLALLHARGTSLVDAFIPALLNDLEALDEELVLVLDDYHLIENEEIHESLAFVIEHLPVSLRLAIATRFDPPLPVARLRAQGELLEIRAEDLRFTFEESQSFLNDVLALDLDREDVERLHERTEGWAAGLYLAALSLRDREDRHGFIAAFAGDDRHVVDYLGAEVLRGQAEEVRTFMLRTSVLDRLSGPLCDAVTGARRSAATLRAIERANLFLVPLDNRRSWYRYHHLFGRLLLHELAQEDPDAIPELHRRAAAWYRRAGSIPEAVHHALEADDVAEARELVTAHWNTYFNQGRLATVAGWLDRLPPEIVSGDARLCIARAWLALDRRLVGDVERWLEAAERLIQPEARVDTAVLRAVYHFKIGDLGRAHDAAREALALADERAVFPRTAAACILGITAYWSGDRDGAAEALDAALDLARAAGNDLGAAYALGYLALVEADRGRLAAAEELADRALRQSDEPGFREHFVLMAAHVALARVLVQRGDAHPAEVAAARALALALRGAGNIELAAAQLALAEAKRLEDGVEAAEALVREASDLLGTCPDAGVVGAAVTGPEEDEPDRTQLTERERAVLRLLATNLSQREIGGALYVSINTVKTHTRGIFRKLHASNRREAVERARALRLI
jgi:LuxR family transcriptional regulator, maltose regulon positive regulatory protein